MIVENGDTAGSNRHVLDGSSSAGYCAADGTGLTDIHSVEVAALAIDGSITSCPSTAITTLSNGSPNRSSACEVNGIGNILDVLVGKSPEDVVLRLGLVVLVIALTWLAQRLCGSFWCVS
jgi:hypothetical protein